MTLINDVAIMSSSETSRIHIVPREGEEKSVLLEIEDNFVTSINFLENLHVTCFIICGLSNGEIVTLFFDKHHNEVFKTYKSILASSAIFDIVKSNHDGKDVLIALGEMSNMIEIENGKILTTILQLKQKGDAFSFCNFTLPISQRNIYAYST